MKTIMKLALLVAALGLGIGCAEEKPPEPPPKVEEPKKPEVPAYEPTGEFADIKKAAAAGITPENAVEQAKSLESELQKEIQTMEAPAGGETK